MKQIVWLGAICLFLALAPQQVQAQQVSNCSTYEHDSNYHPECSNSCSLPQYFQYVFQASYRPHLCNSIPAEFWVYQTQVGEVSSNGKSSGGSASSASAAAASGGNSSSVTLTPSQRVSVGSAVMRFLPKADAGEAAKALDELAGADQDFAAPPLEKSVWIKLLGTIGNKDETPELASIRIESGGVMVGTDLLSTEHLRLGVLGSVSDISVDIRENDNKIDVTAWKVGATGTIEIGNWYLDGLGTHSWEETSTSRTIDINNAGDLRNMWSNFTNRRIHAAFETGFRLNAGRVVIQPLAGVDLNWLKQARVLEKGNSSAAVLTDKNTIFTGTTKLGLNLSTAILLDKVSIVPTIGGYWSHRFGELENANRISTNQGVTYEYVGAKPVLDLANIYGSLMFNIDEHLALSAGYHGAFNREERYHSGNLALRIRF